MEQTSKIRKATQFDMGGIKLLLSAANLPISDLPSNIDNFMVIETDGDFTGVVGLEVFGEYALLRSLAINTNHRSKGVGQLLLERILEHAVNLGVKEVYLVTTTASGFFAKFDFQEIERELVPWAIKRTAQFSGLCPSSAAIMKRTI